MDKIPELTFYAFFPSRLRSFKIIYDEHFVVPARLRGNHAYLSAKRISG